MRNTWPGAWSQDKDPTNIVDAVSFALYLFRSFLRKLLLKCTPPFTLIPHFHSLTPISRESPLWRFSWFPRLEIIKISKNPWSLFTGYLHICFILSYWTAFFGFLVTIKEGISKFLIYSSYQKLLKKAFLSKTQTRDVCKRITDANL